MKIAFGFKYFYYSLQYIPGSAPRISYGLCNKLKLSNLQVYRKLAMGPLTRTVSIKNLFKQWLWNESMRESRKGR